MDKWERGVSPTQDAFPATPSARRSRKTVIAPHKEKKKHGFQSVCRFIHLIAIVSVASDTSPFGLAVCINSEHYDSVSHIAEVNKVKWTGQPNLT